MATNEQIERGRLSEARTLAGMFPADRKVYAYFDREDMHLFDEQALYKISEKLRGQKDARRLFLSKTYEVRRAS